MSAGDYYKYKTKRMLEELGYQVELAEKYVRYYDKKNDSVKIVKKDIFGADLIAINHDTIMFVQVKQGKKNIHAGIKQFAQYNFPSSKVELYIFVWEKGQRNPEIIDVWNAINNS